MRWPTPATDEQRRPVPSRSSVARGHSTLYPTDARSEDISWRILQGSFWSCNHSQPEMLQFRRDFERPPPFIRGQELTAPKLQCRRDVDSIGPAAAVDTVDPTQISCSFDDEQVHSVELHRLAGREQALELGADALRNVGAPAYGQALPDDESRCPYFDVAVESPLQKTLNDRNVSLPVGVQRAGCASLHYVDVVTGVDVDAGLSTRRLLRAPPRRRRTPHAASRRTRR